MSEEAPSIDIGGNPTGTPPTSDQITQIKTALGLDDAALLFPVVFEGDSLTDDAGLTGPNNTWPKLFILENPWMRAGYANVATSGQTMATIVSQYTAQIHPLAPSVSGSGLAFLLAGTNDIGGGASETTIYNDLKTWWAAARADGFKVVAFTVPPRTDYTVGNGKETTRLALNVLIQSDATLYDYLVNPESATSTADTSDGVHFTAAGNLKLAKLVTRTFFGLGNLAGQDASAITGPVAVSGTLDVTSSSNPWSTITLSHASNAYQIINATQTAAYAGWNLQRNGTSKWLVWLGGTSNDFGIYDQARGQDALRILTNGNMRLMPSGGEVLIGSTTDQGAYTLQNTGGFYNSGVMVRVASSGIADTLTWGGAAGTTGGSIFDSTNTGCYLNHTYKSAGVIKWYVGKDNADAFSFYNNASSREELGLPIAGGIRTSKTIVAAGTTGAATISTTTGRVNFAAGATSLVVTNSLCTANSIVLATIATNDATAAGLKVVPAAGSFTIHLGTAPTAETAVSFILLN